MEEKFGVKLKTTGKTVGSYSNYTSSYTNNTRKSRNPKPANFSDLKAKFNSDQSEKSEPQNFGGSDVKVSATNGVVRNIVDRKNSAGDLKLETAAVGKVYGEGENKTFKANLVSSHIQRRGSTDELPSSPTDKKSASSLLSDHLVLMRTRPGSGGSREEKTVTTVTTTETKETGGSLLQYSCTTTTSKMSYNVPKNNYNAKPQGFNKAWQSREVSTTSTRKWSPNPATSSSSGCQDVPELNTDSLRKFNLLTRGTSFENKVVPESVLDQPSRDKIENKTVLESVRNQTTINKAENKTVSGIVRNQSIEDKTENKGTVQSQKIGDKVENKSYNRTFTSTDTKTGVKTTVTTQIKALSKDLDSSSEDLSWAKTRLSPTCQSPKPNEGKNSPLSGKLLHSKSVDDKPEWLDKSKEMISKFQTKLRRTDSGSSDTSASSRGSIGPCGKIDSVASNHESRTAKNSSASNSSRNLDSAASAAKPKSNSSEVRIKSNVSHTIKTSAQVKSHVTLPANHHTSNQPSYISSKPADSKVANLKQTDKKSSSLPMPVSGRRSSNASDSGTESLGSAYLKRVNSFTETKNNPDSVPSDLDSAKRKYVTRKIDSDYFKKLQSSFEQAEKSDQGLKPEKVSGGADKLAKVRTKQSAAILEKQNSLESLSRLSSQGPKRSETLQKLKDAGELENVKEVVRKLDVDGAETTPDKSNIPHQQHHIHHHHHFHHHHPHHRCHHVQQAVNQRSVSSDENDDDDDDDDAGVGHGSKGHIRVEEEVVDGRDNLEEGQLYEDMSNATSVDQDWPDSDSCNSLSDEVENIYECIAARNSTRAGSSGAAGTGTEDYKKIPARRLGQKSEEEIPCVQRKGSDRPSFSEQLSAPSTITEGLSNEEALEELDKYGDADIENDSDSSNSGIYEAVGSSSVEVIKGDNSPQTELPPELPPDRKKNKKKTKGAKTLGKLKKFYKKNNDLPKVSSAPALLGAGLDAGGSSGVFNKIGDKLKLMKRGKLSEPRLLEQEVVVSSSEYDANEEEVKSLSSGKPARDSQSEDNYPYIDSSSSSSSAINMSGNVDKAPEPPPLPPRIDVEAPPPSELAPPPPLPPHRSSVLREKAPKPKGEDTTLAPPLPPKRHSRTLSSGEEELVAPRSPTLPPRNRASWEDDRISTNFDINKVVPLNPGNPAPNRFKASEGSYLHGHNMADIDYIDSDGPEFSTTKKPSEDEDNPYVQPDRRSDPSNPLPYDHSMRMIHSNDNDIYLDMEDNELYGTIGQRYQPKIETEQLYQFYNKDMISRDRLTSFAASDDGSVESDISDDRIYESLDDALETKVKDTKSGNSKEKEQKKISTLEMFGKTGTVLRRMWSDMPEVKSSGLLDNLKAHERKIQEAMFEIITSEATYLRSINVLIDVFLMSPEFSQEMSDRCLVTRQERHVIFSNIGVVRDVSEKFLLDMEAQWQKSVLMEGLCQVIERHASKNFDCYVRYCSNQTFQDRQVQELMKKPEFRDVVMKLQNDPRCQGLPLMSFLLLPMQRITRLPLLVDAVCHRLEPATEKYRTANKALVALNKVVKKCNEGARKMQQTEQMCLLKKSLEFKVKEFPLISASRYLVKQGELTRIITEASGRTILRKKGGKQPIQIFLFSDIILICKKKNNAQYQVIDHAPRNEIIVEALDSFNLPRFLPQGAPSGCKNLFVLVLLENFEKKQVDYILSCNSTSDKTRWMDALSPSAKEDDNNEKIYEEWDCPQVQCVKPFVASEPDELMLEESDVVNVFKKTSDGWYEGERIRDGERGWFLASHTEEILNSHVRARNLRLRFRMMLAEDNPDKS